jgi:hypothetical protein
VVPASVIGVDFDLAISVGTLELACLTQGHRRPRCRRVVEYRPAADVITDAIATADVRLVVDDERLPARWP